jgi:dTDP-4-dehydrorhamnose 3,5-epimerase
VDGVQIGSGDRPIEGVQLVALRRIPDQRGTVQHMLKVTDPHFLQFGEIYFSTVYRGATKAWKRHRRITLNYACVFGRVKVVLCDSRESSPTSGVVMEIFLGPDNHSLVVIPPGIWSGFAGMSDPLSIVANCATEPHDPDEVERVDPATPAIPYRW